MEDFEDLTAVGPRTVPSLPPDVRSQRRSYWTELFDECRVHAGEWRRTRRSFSKSTAAQIASDVRNMATRDPDKMRLRGYRPGDVWEAVWGHDPDEGTRDRCYLWLRFMGGASTDAS